MFVRKSRLTEALDRYRSLGDYFVESRAKLHADYGAALDEARKEAEALRVENERLAAELAAAVEHCSRVLDQRSRLKCRLMDLRAAIHAASAQDRGPRCVACGVPIEDGPPDLCYGCS